MHQLCFLYMPNYPAVYSLSERERGCTHARNYLSKMKIVPTIKNLYHIQCQCVNELRSLVWLYILSRNRIYSHCNNLELMAETTI